MSSKQLETNFNDQPVYYGTRINNGHTERCYFLEKKFGKYKAELTFVYLTNLDLSKNEQKLFKNKTGYNVEFSFLEDRNVSEFDTSFTYINTIHHLVWAKQQILNFIEYYNTLSKNYYIVLGAANQKRFDVYKKVFLKHNFVLRNNNKSFKSNYLIYFN